MPRGLCLHGKVPSKEFCRGEALLTGYSGIIPPEFGKGFVYPFDRRVARRNSFEFCFEIPGFFGNFLIPVLGKRIHAFRRLRLRRFGFLFLSLLIRCAFGRSCKLIVCHTAMGDGFFVFAHKYTIFLFSWYISRMKKRTFLKIGIDEAGRGPWF